MYPFSLPSSLSLSLSLTPPSLSTPSFSLAAVTSLQAPRVLSFLSGDESGRLGTKDREAVFDTPRPIRR